MDPLDIHVVTNYSIGHCRRIIRRIKSEKNKQKHQKVTVEEVGEYLGIPVTLLRENFSKN